MYYITLKRATQLYGPRFNKNDFQWEMLPESSTPYYINTIDQLNEIVSQLSSKWRSSVVQLLYGNGGGGTQSADPDHSDTTKKKKDSFLSQFQEGGSGQIAEYGPDWLLYFLSPRYLINGTANKKQFWWSECVHLAILLVCHQKAQPPSLQSIWGGGGQHVDWEREQCVEHCHLAVLLKCLFYVAPAM